MPGFLVGLILFLGQLAPMYQAATPAPASSAHEAVTVQKPAADSFTASFERLTIGKLFKGEKKLSPEELGHLEFWVALFKEPLLALAGFIPRVFVAGVFLLLFWLIYRGLRRLVQSSMGKAHVDPSIRDMLGHLIKWTVMGFGMVIACNQIGIQITALLTGVSIVGLAIGLAAQETLANFIAGIVIFWDKPFRIGDTIMIDGVAGTVQRVTFRSTRMLDADGQIIILPNTYVLAHRLANLSTHTLGRIHVPIGIAYKESIESARSIALGLAESDERICTDPPPSVVVTDLTDNSVRLMLHFWVREKAIGAAIQCEYVEKVKNAFDAAGIDVPLPQMQLRLDPATPLSELRAAG